MNKNKFLSVLLMIFLLLSTAMEAKPATLAEPNSVTKSRVSEAYGKLPLSFQANQGQANDRVKFLSRGRGYSLFLTSTEAVLALHKSSGPNAQHGIGTVPTTTELKNNQATWLTVLRMRFVEASRNPKVTGLEELPGKVNYFIGNDPKKWHTNIPTYAKVKYQDVYPGVDLIYYGNQRQLEYDLIVAPGTDPKVITLAFEGADKFEIDAQDNLILHAVGEQIRLHKPLIYQDVKNVRQKISGGYVLKDNHKIGFRVAAYDASQPLIIDPVLSYSTYLGGSGHDYGDGIVVDSDGNAYVTGSTNSVILPVPPPPYSMSTTDIPFQPELAGGYDAFVVKLSNDGSALIYGTYLGGNGDDVGHGIAVDSSGNAYVTGRNFSSDFPTTTGAFDESHNGSYDAFVTKLNPTGSSLVYSTFLGGSESDYGNDIAVDTSDNIYVTGRTYSSDFPMESPLQSAFAGDSDAFVTKLDTIVPTWPVGSTLTASNIGLTRLTLTWTPAEDNTGVEDYRVYQDGTLLDTVAGDVLTYDVTCLTASTPYEFKVEAGDATGNWSTDGPSVTVTTLTPQEAIVPLINKVEVLVTKGALNQGRGNSLIAKLEDAIQHLNRENEKPAIKKLEDFISQVNNFIHAEVLLPEEGQPLIDTADDIINQLNC